MTNEERLLFDKLNKDREDTAKALEKPSTRNYTKSVTDKYTDQAHFIYELLQNADDEFIEPGTIMWPRHGSL